MTSLSVPFHFTATFVLTVAAAGGLWVSFRRREFVPPTTWMRRAFIAGFGLLGLAEVIHGARIAPSELEQTVVALRAGAYALFAGSLLPPERSRSARSAAAAAPTGTALPMLLALPAAWFAYRNPLPAAKRLAAAFGLFALSEVVFQTCNCADQAVPGFFWFLAHGARLLGGIAIAYWLWQAIKTSIQARFIAIFMVLLLIVVVSISAAVSQVFASNVSEGALARAAAEGASQNRQLLDATRESLNIARVIAEQQATRQLVANREPSLPGQIQSLQAPGGPFENSDFMAVIDGQGALLAISAKGSGGADNLDGTDALSLAGTAVAQAVIANQAQAGSVDAIGSRKFAVVAGFPIFNPPGFDPPGAPQGLAGVLLLGRVLDQGFLDELRRQDEQEAFLISRVAILGRTTPDPTGVLLTSTEELAQVFDRGQILSQRRVLGIDPIEFFASYIPLKRTDGEVIGALVVAQRSEVLDQTQQDVGRTVFLLALIATAVAVAIAAFSGKRITRPIRDLTAAAEKVSRGDYQIGDPVASSDEVGVLSSAFTGMASSLGELTGQLRLKAEEESKLRGQIETILQSMTDGVIAVDRSGAVVVVNREAERIVGAAQGSLVGKPVSKAVSVTDAAGMSVDLPIYSLEAGSINGSVKRGRVSIPVALTSAPITDDSGELIGAVAVMRDLTSEQQVEKMKTEFLSNISHELRTPLTPIMGYAEILKNKEVPKAKAKEMFKNISSSALRLERIIEMLVDFSAMEAGRLVPTMTTVDLDEVTSELVRRWASYSSIHRFERRGFSKLPNAMLDKRLVPFAIGELIDNAVKFSPKGGRVVLTGESDPSRNGSGALRISVSDQGIGIAKDQLASIGEDFVQVDASETRSYGGMGLGLAYVRRVVEAHGGSLEVETAEGKGSRFTLVLPSSALATRQQTKAAPTAKQPARSSSRPAPRGSIRSKRR